jgi:hypothetical protein
VLVHVAQGRPADACLCCIACRSMPADLLTPTMTAAEVRACLLQAGEVHAAGEPSRVQPGAFGSPAIDVPATDGQAPASGRESRDPISTTSSNTAQAMRSTGSARSGRPSGSHFGQAMSCSGGGGLQADAGTRTRCCSIFEATGTEHELDTRMSALQLQTTAHGGAAIQTAGHAAPMATVPIFGSSAFPASVLSSLPSASSLPAQSAVMHQRPPFGAQSMQGAALTHFERAQPLAPRGNAMLPMQAHSPDSEDDDEPDKLHGMSAGDNDDSDDDEESHRKTNDLPRRHISSACGAMQGPPSASAIAVRDLAAALDNRFEALMLSPDNQVPLLYNSLGRHVSFHGIAGGKEASEPWGRAAVFGSAMPLTKVPTSSTTGASLWLLLWHRCRTACTAHLTSTRCI